jgi:uncharacterized protein (DUF1499 family)
MMKTAAVIIVLLLIVGAAAYVLLEKRPGYGVYYGLAKLTGSPLDIGPVDWATLTRHATPNDALVCATERCPRAKPDREPRVYALEPSALLARLREIVQADGNTAELYCGADCNQRARFIQYTRLMRYPDTIDIAVFPVAGGRSTLAIYSRSLIGSGDFGVNRARIDRWLAALDAS